MATPTIFYLRAGGQAGMGWRGGSAFCRGWGRGYHVVRPGIQSDVGLSSGGRFSDKVTAKPPGLFSPLPLSLSVHLTSLTSHSVLSFNTRSFGAHLACYSSQQGNWAPFNMLCGRWCWCKNLLVWSKEQGTEQGGGWGLFGRSKTGSCSMCLELNYDATKGFVAFGIVLFYIRCHFSL